MPRRKRTAAVSGETALAEVIGSLSTPSLTPAQIDGIYERLEGAVEQASTDNVSPILLTDDAAEHISRMWSDENQYECQKLEDTELSKELAINLSTDRLCLLARALLRVSTSHGPESSALHDLAVRDDLLFTKTIAENPAPLLRRPEVLVLVKELCAQSGEAKAKLRGLISVIAEEVGSCCVDEVELNKARVKLLMELLDCLDKDGPAGTVHLKAALKVKPGKRENCAKLLQGVGNAGDVGLQRDMMDVMFRLVPKAAERSKVADFAKLDPNSEVRLRFVEENFTGGMFEESAMKFIRAVNNEHAHRQDGTQTAAVLHVQMVEKYFVNSDTATDNKTEQADFFSISCNGAIELRSFATDDAVPIDVDISPEDIAEVELSSVGILIKMVDTRTKLFPGGTGEEFSTFHVSFRSEDDRELNRVFLEMLIESWPAVATAGGSKNYCGAEIVRNDFLPVNIDDQFSQPNFEPTSPDHNQSTETQIHRSSRAFSTTVQVRGNDTQELFGSSVESGEELFGDQLDRLYQPQHECSNAIEGTDKEARESDTTRARVFSATILVNSGPPTPGAHQGMSMPRNNTKEDELSLAVVDTLDTASAAPTTAEWNEPVGRSRVLSTTISLTGQEGSPSANFATQQYDEDADSCTVAEGSPEHMLADVDVVTAPQGRVDWSCTSSEDTEAGGNKVKDRRTSQQPTRARDRTIKNVTKKPPLSLKKKKRPQKSSAAKSSENAVNPQSLQQRFDEFDFVGDDDQLECTNNLGTAHKMIKASKTNESAPKRRKGPSRSSQTLRKHSTKSAEQPRNTVPSDNDASTTRRGGTKTGRRRRGAKKSSSQVNGTDANRSDSPQPQQKQANDSQAEHKESLGYPQDRFALTDDDHEEDPRSVGTRKRPRKSKPSTRKVGRVDTSEKSVAAIDPTFEASTAGTTLPKIVEKGTSHKDDRSASLRRQPKRQARTKANYFENDCSGKPKLDSPITAECESDADFKSGKTPKGSAASHQTKAAKAKAPKKVSASRRASVVKNGSTPCAKSRPARRRSPKTQMAESITNARYTPVATPIRVNPKRSKQGRGGTKDSSRKRDYDYVETEQLAEQIMASAKFEPSADFCAVTPDTKADLNNSQREGSPIRLGNTTPTKLQVANGWLEGPQQLVDNDGYTEAQPGDEADGLFEHLHAQSRNSESKRPYTPSRGLIDFEMTVDDEQSSVQSGNGCRSSPRTSQGKNASRTKLKSKSLRRISRRLIDTVRNIVDKRNRNVSKMYLKLAHSVVSEADQISKYARRVGQSQSLHHSARIEETQKVVSASKALVVDGQQIAKHLDRAKSDLKTQRGAIGKIEANAAVAVDKFVQEELSGYGQSMSKVLEDKSATNSKAQNLQLLFRLIGNRDKF